MKYIPHISNHWIGLGLVGILMVCASCRPTTTPRPYGYYRITVPDTAYAPLPASYPLNFDMSQWAKIVDVPHEGEGRWFTIHYPALRADIHCTYYPLHHNLREMTDDAMEFVHKHISQAQAIPSQAFANDDAKVYGALFTITGNTASPYQFFVTDSVQHFFRGAVYCDCRPNIDSLQPVLDYLKIDVQHIMETITWE